MTTVGAGDRFWLLPPIVLDGTRRLPVPLLPPQAGPWHISLRIYIKSTDLEIDMAFKNVAELDHKSLHFD